MVGAEETALYLGEGFYKGSSRKSSTFGNQMLSGSQNFNIIEFEVWSLSL